MDRNAPDLILHNGAFTTLDRGNPTASAVAIKNGRFTRVGRDAEIVPTAGPATKVVDLGGRRVLPGLCDTHTHIIRGGLNFNMELRWDGVPSLADAMRMLERQVAVTPPPQSRRQGGWRPAAGRAQRARRATAAPSRTDAKLRCLMSTPSRGVRLTIRFQR